jgi:hypothetical protein
VRLSTVIAVWGAANVAFAVPLLWRDPGIAPAMLGAAGAAAVVTGLVMRLTSEAPPQGETLPDLSLPTAFAGMGAIIIFAGAAVGAWLSVIGAGVLLAAVVAILREEISRRRAVER